MESKAGAIHTNQFSDFSNHPNLTNSFSIKKSRVYKAGQFNISKTNINSSAEDVHSQPKIQLHKENDVLRAVEITCTCGENIKLFFEYDD